MDGVMVATEVGRAALEMTVVLSLPMLIVGLVVGVIISIFQAATQVQEQTLSFIPKIVAMLAALYIFMPTLIRLLVDYSKDIFLSLQAVRF